MSSTEREIKRAIASAAGYEQLCVHLGAPARELVQDNSYWDTPERRLTAAGIMLRLRIAGARALLTIKRQARRRSDGLFEAREDEAEVPLAEAREVLAGERPLAALGGPLAALAAELGELGPLRPWGNMRNVRREYPLGDGLTLELDRTEFPDGSVAFEAELESDAPDAALARLTEVLQQAGVEHRPQTRTKAERLQAILEEGS